MKKVLIIFIAVIMVLSFAACGHKKIEGGLEELMYKIYEDANVEKEFYEEMTFEPVEQERNFWFFGTDNISYKEAFSCEPFISIYTYCMVLVRINENDDIEAVKKVIKDNVNPQKWVCVGVDPDEVYVESNGDLILLLMCRDADMSAKLVEAFKALGK